jgi:hypothetical protein
VAQEWHRRIYAGATLPVPYYAGEIRARSTRCRTSWHRPAPSLSFQRLGENRNQLHHILTLAV